MKDKDEIVKKIKLVPKQLIVYGNGDDFPSNFNWFEMTEPWGWSVHVDIRFNMKGEVKTTFTVDPPLSNKKKKELKFKTHSYAELRKWLKKHKGLIEGTNLTLNNEDNN